MTGAVHVEEFPLARIAVARAVFVVSAVLGLLSATAGLVLAAFLRESLNFDGPVSDVPVIPERSIARVQGWFWEFGAFTLAMAMVAAGAVLCLRWGVWRRIGGWLLVGFVVLGLVGFVPFAEMMSGGREISVEATRSALPGWWVSLVVILWLSHVVSYLCATALLSRLAQRTGVPGPG